MSTSNGWIRVALGARKVVLHASKNNNVLETTLRTVQHGNELGKSLQVAATMAMQQLQLQPQQQFEQQFQRQQNNINNTAVSSSTTTTTMNTNTNYSPSTMDGLDDDESRALDKINQEFADILAAAEKEKDNETIGTTTTTKAIANNDNDNKEEEEIMKAEEEVVASHTKTTTTTTANTEGKDAAAAAATTQTLPPPPSSATNSTTITSNNMETAEVPSSRIGRAFGFASLGVGLAFGTVAEASSRLLGGGSDDGSIVVNDANADRLASTLCRMRGAALKLGQMLSIQDETLLPPALATALHKVRKGADAMPLHQLQSQLETQLGGVNWKEEYNIINFDDQPFAAASIGQVHRAKIVLESDTTNADDDDSTKNDKTKDVVIKVQYPGVGNSIESDLRNLSMLIRMTGMAPKGLFLDNVIRVGRDELLQECNYTKEATNQRRMKDFVDNDSLLQTNNFVVPEVRHATEQVLIMDYHSGGTIDKVLVQNQEERDRIGRMIFHLTMQELFVWKFMQTDPNWGNFLYDVHTKQTTLLDFGACREYSSDFVDGYLRIVWANANRDADTLLDISHRMGFLTGDENDTMINAHIQSGFTLGEPFYEDKEFDFRHSEISSRLSEHSATFMKHRLTPPPEEVYTLHRKLAGAFMLCIKLGARVNCRQLLTEIVSKHQFQDGMEHPMG